MAYSRPVYPWVFLSLLAPLAAQVGKPFRIEDLQCKALSCSTAEGWQPGLTTVEAEGRFPSSVGGAVLLTVNRRGVPTPVFDRAIGVTTDGEATITIPAYDLPDGEYSFGLSPLNDTEHLVGSGAFRKLTPGAPARSEEKSDGRPAATAAIVGRWRSINGTTGLLVIKADGTYSFNGARSTYRLSGHQVTFLGPLRTWNQGRATWRNDVVEFHWTTPRGAKRRLTFASVR
jgi:hypothetical protein